MNRFRCIFGALTIAGVLVTGCGSSSTATEQTDDSPSTQVDSRAYDYFGELSMAPGSSVNTRIDKVAAVSDIEVVEQPDGLVAEFVEGDDGSVRLNIEVDKDQPAGVVTVVFAIAGEADPVSWTFTIL